MCVNKTKMKHTPILKTINGPNLLKMKTLPFYTGNLLKQSNSERLKTKEIGNVKQIIKTKKCIKNQNLNIRQDKIQRKEALNNYIINMGEIHSKHLTDNFLCTNEKCVASSS